MSQNDELIEGISQYARDNPHGDECWCPKCGHHNNKDGCEWCKLQRKLQVAKDALKWIAEAGDRENALLRSSNIVFDKWPKIGHHGTIVLDGYTPPSREGFTAEERWQAIAFTLHTNLWEIATQANQALETEDEK